MTGGTGRETPRRNPINRALGSWQPARVLMAANHLNFFTAIGEESLSAEEVASRCNTHPRSTEMLLNACASLILLEKEGNLFRNSPEALESLVRGKLLLSKAYDSLIPGGLVVVYEGLINEDGTSPMRAVLFSLNMLVNTGEGKSYSGSEIMRLMIEAGFIESRVVHLTETVGTSLVISVKP